MSHFRNIFNRIRFGASFNACLLSTVIRPLPPISNVSTTSINLDEKQPQQAKQGVGKIIHSNKQRKGKRKGSYTNEIKLSVIDYHIKHGGSYQDTANSDTFALYNLNRNTVGDWYRNRDKIRKEVAKGNGQRKKAHKGSVLKHPMLEEPIKREYNLRKKLKLDCSRQWMLKRAKEMHFESQINNCIRELPVKSPADWTPFEIIKENKIVKDLDDEITKRLADGSINVFPCSISWFYSWISRNDKCM